MDVIRTFLINFMGFGKNGIKALGILFEDASFKKKKNSYHLVFPHYFCFYPDFPFSNLMEKKSCR